MIPSRHIWCFDGEEKIRACTCEVIRSFQILGLGKAIIFSFNDLGARKAIPAQVQHPSRRHFKKGISSIILQSIL